MNEFKPNFGGGLYYSKKNFFVGFSVPFLLNNASSIESAGDLAEIQERRYYFLRSGAIFNLTRDENIKLNPSFLVRSQEGQPLSMDVNLGFILYNVVNLGISYRSGDAIITFIDLKLSEKFHFAYSYDWTSSPLKRFSNGSHEFTLNYRAKVTQAHKNLACPNFYNYDGDGPQPSRRRRR
jgi:type IX secretion system PorP/SprF family membrane protein